MISETSKLLFDSFYRKLVNGQNELYPVPEKLKTTKHLQFPEKNSIFDWVCRKENPEVWCPWISVADSDLPPAATVSRPKQL